MRGGVTGFTRMPKLPTESRQVPSESEEIQTPLVSQDKPTRKPRTRRKPVAVPVEDTEGVASEPGV